MFDFSKLKGKIKEVCNTETDFARMMGINRSTMSQKLNGKSEFSSTDIAKACQILSIDVSEVGDYFFKIKVSK